LPGKNQEEVKRREAKWAISKKFLVPNLYPKPQEIVHDREQFFEGIGRQRKSRFFLFTGHPLPLFNFNFGRFNSFLKFSLVF